MRGTGERGDPWKKGHWTAEEDKQLMQVVASCGEGQWNKLAKAAGLLRCGKSCRLRWVNYLRPGVKRGQISDAEERLIIQLHGLFGRRWSVIAAHLPGRSDNEIKNYWRSHVRKKVKSNRDYYLYHGGPAMAAALAAVEKEEEEEETVAATAAEVYAGDGDGDGGENRCVNISHADAIAGTGMNIAPAMKKETVKKMEMDETVAAKKEAFHAGDLSEQLAVVTKGGVNYVPASSIMASPDQRNGSRCGNIVTHPGKKGGLVPCPASVASEITCLSPRSSSSGSHIAGFGENSERSSGNLSGFGENDRSDAIATIAATSCSCSSSSSIDNIAGFVENGGRRNSNIPGYGENDNVSGNGENGGRISNISGYGEDGYIGGRNGNISGGGENSDISECFRKDGNISGYVENEGTRNGNISDYFGKNGNVSGVGENGGTKYFGKNGNFPEVGGNGGGNVVNISEDFGKNGNVSGNISGVCENGGRDCVNISGFSEINGGRNGNVSDHQVGKNGKGSDSGPASSVVNSKACFYSSPSFSSSSSSSSLSSFSDAGALPPDRHSQSLSCLATSEWLPYPDSPLTLSFSWDVQSCLEIASPHYDSDYDPLLPFSDHLWS